MRLTAAASAADVVVIGAGLSGLQTAVNIQAAGFSCLVLEAIDRVGGKVLSIKSSSKGDGVNDEGAAWVNDSNQSEIWKLFEKYDIGAITQRITGLSFQQAENGSVEAHPYDKDLPEGDVGQAGEIQRIYEAIEQAVNASNLEYPEIGPDAHKLDNMTFAEFGQETSPTLGAVIASLAAGALLGVEANEVSALFMVNYIKSGFGIKIITSDAKDGGQYIRARRGMQAIAEGLASELTLGSLHLNTAVKSIEQKDDGLYEVNSAAGAVFTAKHVVVSIPTPLYKTIEFTPALPESKRNLGENTTLGYYSKVTLVFENPWWQTANLSGVMTSMKGPISFTRDTSSPDDDQWSITCFVVGEMGRVWNKLSEAERQKAVLEQFNTVFSTATAVPEPIAIHEKIWADEPFFFGAPSPVMAPGVLTSLGSDVLREQARNIHFVGTETSVVWKGYMDGAVRSGQRGAEEVIKSLRGTRLRLSS
ncbi:putative amine oxidase [Annulohypoxylon maeteangense]|uniref:putative amine oxidase n=1 Tax=Annulohypoxylon maeteangense TaxID=1927788 RepID=UPI0020073A2A|nr:putative amine oxidase [Annulohypoxylon maeteangense]KAI0885021.1 putative amine oxidase [Annulohypoxylon maeteangense]